MERKWKALILVDGYNGGVAHITADQIRDHNIAMYGTGDYVLPVGDQFAYEIVNNNTVNLSSGMVVMNGARAVTGYGKTDTLTIENGTSGYKRSDIIVAEYSKDNESLVESVTVKVVKGTLGSDYSDPALVTGDIRAGATKRQMALYRVKVNGLSIEAVEKMWTAAVATLGANIVPITKGGTGATTPADALAALGVYDHIIEVGKTSDGVAGYIKTANGTLFQYGRSGAQTGSGTSTIAVKFPVNFKDINYNFVAVGGYNCMNAPIAENLYTTGDRNRSETQTTVSVYKEALPYWVDINWMAIGSWK